MRSNIIRIKKRGPIEIIFNILESIYKSDTDGIGKTSIMYSSNLNWKQLEEYMNYLLDVGLIEERCLNGSSKFFLTRKGFSAIEHFNKLFDLLSSY